MQTVVQGTPLDGICTDDDDDLHFRDVSKKNTTSVLFDAATGDLALWRSKDIGPRVHLPVEQACRLPMYTGPALQQGNKCSAQMSEV